MDLSHQVKHGTRLLLRTAAPRLRATVHRPSAMTLGHYVVIMTMRYRGQGLGATGTARHFVAAWTKALAELGECLVGCDRQLPHRSGLAGGLLAAPTLERAKAELLERDAFFFHYRHDVPFASRLDVASPIGPLWGYRMQTADPEYCAILVTDPISARGAGACLLFATAAGHDEAAITRKAVAEYTNIHLMHRVAPERCRAMEQPSDAPVLADFHHAASRDPRNQARFARLCRTRGGGTSSGRPHVDAAAWRIERLGSPLRGFVFFHAANDDLIPIEFGRPEPGIDPTEPPLFHPFW